MTTAKSTAPKKRASKKESGPKSNKKGAVHKQVKEDRRAKAHPDSKPNPLTPMFQTIGVVDRDRRPAYVVEPHKKTL